MQKLSIFLMLVFFISLCCSCEDKSVNEDQDVSAIFKQGKCGETFSKVISQDSDSVFSYSFYSNLIIDFSVNANCCPDSNRFSVTHIISSDTIHITVADTAANLCRCICPYMIQAEFTDLSNDSYVVVCEKSGGYSLHNVIVHK
jgi:hypothetical protein